MYVCVRVFCVLVCVRMYVCVCECLCIDLCSCLWMSVCECDCLCSCGLCVNVIVWVCLCVCLPAVVAIEKGLQINHAAFDCRGSRRNQPAAASIRFMVHFTSLSRTNRSGFSFVLLFFRFFLFNLSPLPPVPKDIFAFDPFYTHAHFFIYTFYYIYI